jgi:predicted N-acyltransferase
VANDYCTQVVDDPARIDRDAWNALVDADAEANPFLRYEYLAALAASGAAAAPSGWHPRFLLLTRGEALVAAAPRYVKDHSYGEYVFDWSWAEAYQRYDLAYYPKWLVAVPFTPVPGTRLLARDEPARRALAAALLGQARESGLSSLHVLLAPPRDIDALVAAGMVVRDGVQFHWRNAGYADFEDFLARLAQPKRKKIRAERRKVSDAGVTLQRRVGREITEADWRFFFRCYLATYRAHFSSPYLNLDFFLRIAEALPEHLMMVLAQRDGRSVASALGVFDVARAEPRLYGRYWGAVERIDSLHFECCYYQMIDFAIERKLAWFEGGAQGAHKLARGLDPVATRSAHWLAHPAMMDAVTRFVERERAGVAAAIDDLNEHRAFKETFDLPLPSADAP